MTHISCDTCGKDLPYDGEDRFTVRMDTRMVVAEPPELTDDDLDDQGECDSVHEMTLLLEGEFEKAEYSPPRPARLISKEFDFCNDCYRRFSADPLGLERVSHRRFSAN
jgi:hypothetical protein